MLYRLVYASAATRSFSEEELVEILRKARDNNKTLDITGILLHKGDNFIQALEGPKDAVKSLFFKIEKDKRHRMVYVLTEGEIKEREFGDWSMGFTNISKLTEKDVPGLNDYFQKPMTPDALKGDTTRVKLLLDTFREITR